MQPGHTSNQLKWFLQSTGRTGKRSWESGSRFSAGIDRRSPRPCSASPASWMPRGRRRRGGVLFGRYSGGFLQECRQSFLQPQKGYTRKRRPPNRPELWIAQRESKRECAFTFVLRRLAPVGRWCIIPTGAKLICPFTARGAARWIRKSSAIYGNSTRLLALAVPGSTVPEFPHELERYVFFLVVFLFLFLFSESAIEPPGAVCSRTRKGMSNVSDRKASRGVKD